MNQVDENPIGDVSALFLITGIMAAGKSTVAQALAERFDRSVHLRGDSFRRFVVSGRSEMSGAPTPEALEQLRLRYELAAASADRYVEAGFVTVMQDVILGPWLPDVIAMFRTQPVSVVVLAPSAEVVAGREAERPKTGYTTLTPTELDAGLREGTPRLGLWIDNGHQTVAETVQEILDRRAEADVGVHPGS